MVTSAATSPVACPLAPVLVELPGGHLPLERGCHARVDVRGQPVEQHLDDLAGTVVPLRSYRLGAGLAGIAAGKGQERSMTTARARAGSMRMAQVNPPVAPPWRRMPSYRTLRGEGMVAGCLGRELGCLRRR
jgi:hypothetical protein